jgi:hypothetical protein
VLGEDAEHVAMLYHDALADLLDSLPRLTAVGIL